MTNNFHPLHNIIRLCCIIILQEKRVYGQWWVVFSKWWVVFSKFELWSRNRRLNFF